MPGVINRLAAAKVAAMLADDRAVLTDHDALGKSLDLDGTTDGVRRDRIFIVVKAHQAGLRDRGLHRRKTIKRAGDLNQLQALRLKHLPNRALAQLGMLVRLGVSDAAVEQPGVQLLIARHPQPWREEALAHDPDLVLDLALLPARRRRAGNRIDQVMPAHLQKATVEQAILADEHALNRGLHVVVDTARAGPPENPKTAVLRA